MQAVYSKTTNSIESNRYTRRTLLGGAAALVASPALAAQCPIGPPPHTKGAKVWLDMDQFELDAAYNQAVYAPLLLENIKRYASNSAAVRARIGDPQRVAYGKSDTERLDIFKATRADAPIFVFIHGGAWLQGHAKSYAYPAEMFNHVGAHYIALDFTSVNAAGGDLQVMARQIRNAIAWIYKNAKSFGGDPHRVYIGGHSSGGHLCGVALVTDWQTDFGLPKDTVKGGLCMSGMYDLKPVRLSSRSKYLNFDDAMEDAMSSQRHIDQLHAPIIVTYGSNETPEFQRQNRDFAAAVKAAGKPVELIEAAHYNHFEMCDTLNNPFGPNGRAALKLMNLSL
jgi:arylformamidase